MGEPHGWVLLSPALHTGLLLLSRSTGTIQVPWPQSGPLKLYTLFAPGEVHSGLHFGDIFIEHGIKLDLNLL